MKKLVRFNSLLNAEKILMLLFLLAFPSLVLGDCTCDAEEEDKNRSLALKYRFGAIAAIFLASLVGVCLPVLGKKIPSLSPENNFFFIIKAFAAGVILATGFIHVLPDAFESLTSPCLPQNPWGKFPFTGFVAMLAAIGALMVDVYATSHYRNKSGNGKGIGAVEGDGENQFSGLPLHTDATHGHAHASVSVEGGSIPNQLRYRVISQAIVQLHTFRVASIVIKPYSIRNTTEDWVNGLLGQPVLELGIIVHSVIIGIALGASDNPKIIRPLLAALTFHQFFEGIGLGGCITQAKFKAQAITIMALFFSLTTPFGIAIGIGISNVYNENSPNALIVQGIFDAASSGILVYMALVDLLSADFMNPKMQSNARLLQGANISLLFGAGCMSLLAKWA